MSKTSELFEAIRKEDENLCIELLKPGSRWTKREINAIVSNSTCLAEACVKGYRQIVHKILQKGGDCNHRVGTRTPLIIAADNGHEGVVQEITEEGDNCDINAVDNLKQTALYHAARNGHLGCVEVLVKKLQKANASVDIASEEGKTPLYVALERSHNECVNVLLMYGADPNTNTASGNRTPLHAATVACNLKGLKLVAGKCSDINVTDSQGKTALHLLVTEFTQGGQEDMVLECCNFLAEKNINLFIKDKAQKSALDYAAKMGDSSVLRYLQRDNKNMSSTPDIEEERRIITKRMSETTIRTAMKKKSES